VIVAVWKVSVRVPDFACKKLPVVLNNWKVKYRNVWARGSMRLNTEQVMRIFELRRCATMAVANDLVKVAEVLRLYKKITKITSQHTLQFFMLLTTLGQVFSEYFGFPCQSFHQFFSIIIITRGWHNTPLVAAVPSGPNCIHSFEPGNGGFVHGFRGFLTNLTVTKPRVPGSNRSWNFSRMSP
jgi:hypothetical protein